LIDAHSHFDDASFDLDREQALQRAYESGVREQVIPGVIAAGCPRIRDNTLWCYPDERCMLHSLTCIDCRRSD
ncbi:MAG: TatD family hydrolase, partial [Candidatus Thiodiazotropha sp.]